MAFSTSDKRLTRSQARAGTPALAGKTPNGATTPSSAIQNTQSFSKAGRRVLAELACNDSPIVGLLPAGTPTSCKSKSSDGGPIRSRRALLADAVPTHPASTPLGESLLRSQVQMLLQKVGSDICAKQHEKALPLHLGNYAMGMSPTMLAAPTPLNTPASLTNLFQKKSLIPDSDFSSQRNAIMEVAEFPTSSSMMAKHPESHEESLDAAPMEQIHGLQQSVSKALTSTDVQPRLLEVSDTPSSSEIFIGKRVLHFDEDTPSNASQEVPSSRVCFAEETGQNTPELRQLDDDEASEWSVSVNVGSPADKSCLGEVSEGTAASDTSSSSSVGELSMLHEHVENMQQASSHKVCLLWDKDVQRDAVQAEKLIEGCCNKEEEDDGPVTENDEGYTEDYYSGEENEEEYGGAYEGGEECDDLCDMFRGMGFGEIAGNGLPKGEGKHIRFLYEDGDDEIVEAMVVSGEEDVLCSSGAIRLKGLPAPSGRHWRFEQEE